MLKNIIVIINCRGRKCEGSTKVTQTIDLVLNEPVELIHHQRRRREGFSLVEVLISIGILSSIVGVSVFALSYLKGTKQQKLKTNVAMLNSAARLYEANGGSLEGIVDHRQVIARLKTVSSNWKEIAGLRHSMVDVRLDIEETSKDGGWRAVWVPEKKRFTLAKAGTGIADFFFNEKLSEDDVVAEKRLARFEFAEHDTWVWDYEDRDTAVTGDPSFPSDPNGTAGGGGGTSDALVLDPPGFSTSGGMFPMEAFEIDVTLINPNPSYSSVVLYAVSAGTWKEYAGETISVEPGTSIEAYAKSRDPGWSDSEHALEFYQLEEAELEIAINFEKAAYNFMELGGAMLPGIYEPVLAQPGLVTMDHISSEYFKYLYNGMIRFEQTVTDGNGNVVVDSKALSLGTELAFATPLGSNVSLAPSVSDVAYTDVPGSTLSDAEIDSIVNGQQPVTAPIPISLSTFGNTKSATIEVVAQSSVPEFQSSPVKSVTLEAEKINLSAPVITEEPRPDGITEVGVHFVSMELESTLGNVPEGARIFYTTDDSDPGDDGIGGPSSATAQLYEGPFLIAQPRNVPIRARVYGPDGHQNWFDKSPPETIVWPPPPDLGFSMNMSPNNTGESTPPGQGNGPTWSTGDGNGGNSPWDGGFFNNPNNNGSGSWWE